MLLAIDVGNTNITLGVFDGEKLIGNFRLNTKTPRTSDEYGFAIRDILKENGIHKTGEGPEKKAIKAALFHPLFRESCIRLLLQSSNISTLNLLL